MPVHEIRNVRSSNGTLQERIFIKTKINLCGKSYTAQLSLADRTEMKYPMLIGRKFLEGRYIVDVAMKYQQTKGKKK